MQDMIKEAVLKLFPELSGGLHLDRYARVVGVADQPEEGASCERFRPRFAVDIEVLTPEMEPDSNFPKFTAVPLPIPSGTGGEAGILSFPEPGALVTVGFAYGRADHPIIRQIYPMGSSLPQIAPGEVLLQKSPAVFQKADEGGNWQRVTDADITDDSVTRSVKAVDGRTELAREEKAISEHSKIEVGGVQTIEAGVMLDLLAGQRADLGTLGELNLSAGANSTHSTGGNATETVGANKDSKIMGNRAVDVTGSQKTIIGAERDEEIKGSQKTQIGAGRDEKIGADQMLEVSGSNTEKAGGAKVIEASSILLQSGSTISCVSAKGGGAGMSLFAELLAALDEVKAALDVLASHTHPQVPVIAQGGAVSGHSAGLQEHRNNMGSITK